MKGKARKRTQRKWRDRKANPLPVSLDGMVAFLTDIPVPEGHKNFMIVTDGIELPSDENSLPLLKTAKGDLSVLFFYEDDKRQI